MTHRIEQKDKIYTCPMHPEVQSDQPGSCPKCGMKLVTKDKQQKRENYHSR